MLLTLPFIAFQEFSGAYSEDVTEHFHEPEIERRRPPLGSRKLVHGLLGYAARDSRFRKLIKGHVAFGQQFEQAYSHTGKYGASTPCASECTASSFQFRNHTESLGCF